MILASAVPGGFAGRAADLGSGAGAAGLCGCGALPESPRHACRTFRPDGGFCPQDHRSTRLMQLLAGRIDILEADVALKGKARVFAGLADNSFDFAIMNPPFNEPRDRTTPDPLKAEAHVMPEGMFEQWVRTAAAIVKPGGGIAIIARPGSIRPILDALGAVRRAEDRRHTTARRCPGHPHRHYRHTRQPRGALAHARPHSPWG